MGFWKSGICLEDGVAMGEAWRRLESSFNEGRRVVRSLIPQSGQAHGTG